MQIDSGKGIREFLARDGKEENAKGSWQGRGVMIYDRHSIPMLP
jgi:hypothetical protein